MSHGHINGPLRLANHVGGLTRAAELQSRHQVLEAVALVAEQAFFGHKDVFEGDVPRGQTVVADFLERGHVDARRPRAGTASIEIPRLPLEPSVVRQAVTM